MNDNLNDIFRRIDATLAKAATKDDVFRISAICVVAVWSLVAIMTWGVVVAIYWIAP